MEHATLLQDIYNTDVHTVLCLWEQRTQWSYINGAYHFIIVHLQHWWKHYAVGKGT